MNGFIKETSEDWMWRLRYVEVVIKYKGNRYHIEAGNKKYTVGVFNKEKYQIESYFSIVGNNNDEAFLKLMNEPLFDGQALKDIIDKIEWLEG